MTTDHNIRNSNVQTKAAQQPPLHVKSEHGISKQNFLLILSWEMKQRNFQSLSVVVSTPGNTTAKTNQNISYDKLKGKRDKRNRGGIKINFSEVESFKKNHKKTNTKPPPSQPPQNPHKPTTKTCEKTYPGDAHVPIKLKEL